MSLGARSAAQLPQQNLEVQGRAKSRVPGPVVKVLVMPGRDGSPCVSLGGPCAAVKSWRCQAGTGSPVCWASVCEVLEAPGRVCEVLAAPGRECPPYVSHARWSGQSCRDYRHVGLSRRGQLRAIRVRSSWRTGRQFPPPATGPQLVSAPFPQLAGARSCDLHLGRLGVKGHA